jgi:hypothetical protein
MSLKDIDWKAPENLDEPRRPFTVKVEESVARAFIQAVQSRGLFVRETVVKLMREFARLTSEGVEDGQGTEKTDRAGRKGP